jgi:hypothetical protein
MTPRFSSFARTSIRRYTLLVILWLTSLLAVGAWGQSSAQPDTRVISGSDLGFRVERLDAKGSPVGSLVVRVNGKWVEPSFSPKSNMITNK